MIRGAVALAVLGAIAPVDSAEALSIRMIYGGTTVTVADGQAGSPNDTDPLSATVQYEEGTLGNAFFAPLGFTEVDVIGSRCTVCPSRLTLSVEAARSAPAANDFIVEVSDVGFSAAGPSLLGESDFTAIIDGVSAEYETFIDTSNALFGTGTLVDADTLTGTSGSSLQSLVGIGAGLYSMTIRVTYDGTTWLPTPAGTVESQAQFRTSDVPVPAALPLFALGLAALGAAAGRRRRSG